MIERVIVGLGNPGSQYTHSPHNLGFRAVDGVAKALGAGPFRDEAKFHCQLSLHNNLAIIKPLTYMNKSGDSIASFVHFYKLKPESVWVVHDDFDIPFGQLKISQRKSPANHGGVTSIANRLGSTNFVRFRMGIGKEGIHNLEDYVTSPLAAENEPAANALIQNTAAAVQTALQQGIAKAMNQYNK